MISLANTSSPAKVARVGVIGCGFRISQLLGRIRRFSSAVRFDAICDPDSNRTEWATRELNPSIRVYSDHRALVADPELDWVIIGSLNAQHAEHAVAALDAGKHVICEKPLATTLEDCVAIRDAVERNNRTLAVGFTMRYAATERKIKQCIDAGMIGRPVSLEFNETLGFNHGGMIHSSWRRFTSNAGSHLLEKCCHDIDSVNWFLGSTAKRVASFGGCNFFTPEHREQIDRLGVGPNGEPPFRADPRSRVDPFTADKDIVDNQVVIIEYDSGVRASFHLSCCTAIPERRIYISGTEGTLRGDRVTGRLEVQRIGWDEPMTVWPDTRTEGGHGGADEILCREWIEMMTEGAQPRATVIDGMRAAVTCFAIDEAAQRGAVIDLSSYWQAVRWTGSSRGSARSDSAEATR